MWEYPGGKLEEGESLEQALQRELREELGVHVGECQYLASIGMYFEVPALVLLFLCRKIEGSPQPHAAQSLAWVDPTEAIANMPMVPSCYLFYPHVLRAIAEETIDI
jgi:8-oxo-dGTP diphosphatase